MQKNKTKPKVKAKPNANFLKKLFILVVVVFAISQIFVWAWPGVTYDDRLKWFRYTGFVTAIPLLWALLRPELNAAMKLVCPLVGVTLAGATWFSVVEEGYYGDASPMMGWRFDAQVNDLSSQPLATVSQKVQRTSDESSVADSGWEYAGFLGTNRNATVTGLKLDTDWTTSAPKERWRVPVGPGWSSFAIAGNSAITQEQLGEDEAIVCRNIDTGSILWTALNKAARFTEVYGGDGPRATPTIYQDKVYALGAKGDLHCVELQTGSVVWKRNILADAGVANLEWGMAGSPLVFGELVVVAPGGKDHSVVAYDRNNGEPVWHAGSGRAAYASPALVEFGGVRQVVHLNGPGLEGYSAVDGRFLWSYEWIVNGGMMTSVSQPVVLNCDANSCDFFLSSGYGKGCIRLNVVAEEGKFEVKESWPLSRAMKSKFNTVVQLDGFAYGMDDKVLTCVDLTNGRRKWKNGRYGYGQLMLVDDVLLIQAESGGLALVQATPEKYRELGRVSPLSRKTWNPPALSGNRLLVRNDKEAVCLELELLNDDDGKNSPAMASQDLAEF